MSQSSLSHPPLLPLALGAGAIAVCVAFFVDAEALHKVGDAVVSSAEAQPVQVASLYEPPSLAPSAIVLNGTSAYRMEEGKVKFFFAPSRTELRQAADEGLKQIVEVMQNGQRVQIAGFHDETGNAAQNTMLAKQRAVVVQKRLIELGAPAKAIALGKPALATDANSHEEARRVEVVFVK